MTEFNHNIPVYVQIIELLKQQIISARLKTGDKMPSVRDLATQMQVNPNTVQRAYKELETMGLIESRRGMGSYVTEDVQKLKAIRNDMAISMSQEFISKMLKIGFEVEEVLEYMRNNLKKGE